MQKVQGQEPALEETRNSKVTAFILLPQDISIIHASKRKQLCIWFLRSYEEFSHLPISLQVYAAITNTHLTEPQVLHGGKVSLFDNGILDFSPFFLQKCAYNPDSGHFSPVL
jgi:hypothetical protein